VAGAPGLILEKLTFAGLAPLAFLWFAFVLSYTDRREFLTRRRLVALFAWPVAVVILSWTPEGTGLRVAVWSTIEAEQGAVFWGHVLLSYGLFAAGTALLLRHLAATSSGVRGWRSSRGPRSPGGGSVVAVSELFGDLHLHSLPGGFVLMGVCFLWAVVGTGATRITWRQSTTPSTG